jgi:hypothetical protein
MRLPVPLANCERLAVLLLALVPLNRPLSVEAMSTAWPFFTR